MKAMVGKREGKGEVASGRYDLNAAPLAKNVSSQLRSSAASARLRTMERTKLVVVGAGGAVTCS